VIQPAPRRKREKREQQIPPWRRQLHKRAAVRPVSPLLQAPRGFSAVTDQRARAGLDSKIGSFKSNKYRFSTGKELVAKAIHARSQRHKQIFVTLNCAANPGPLFESELFGHERGAFTGAYVQKVGRLELANRGTLFLDEVGELALELQPKLLRTLQERAYERVGSARTKSVDLRLVSATNCDLGEMMAKEQFRSDLYYRLNVFPICIPPLRERRADIPPPCRALY
jgi:transcriptional regulator of acetoin/glycerol metabolism